MSKHLSDQEKQPPGPRRGVVERYSVAAASGCDLDIHGAAGMVGPRHELGLALLRVRAEFDTVRAKLSRANTARRTGRPMQPEDIIMARAEALMAMETLEPCKRLLIVRASSMATKKRFMQPYTVVAQLLGKVLDVFLDQTCHVCDGTGHVGNQYAGETKRECRACRGTGSRRDTIGANAEQKWFAYLLFADMQHAAADAASELRKRVSPTIDKMLVDTNNPRIARNLDTMV